jgi:hypothetical protein
MHFAKLSMDFVELSMNFDWLSMDFAELSKEFFQGIRPLSSKYSEHFQRKALISVMQRLRMPTSPEQYAERQNRQIG